MTTRVTLRLDATYDPDAKALVVLLPEDIDADTLAFKRRAVVENGERAEDVPFTEAELDEMLKPRTPLSGAEIAAKIVAEGAAWADLGIEDGAEWVNEQKRKRQESRKWQLEL